MAWTYLQFDESWEQIPGSPELPGPQTVYLGFDVRRNAVVLGYTERGGYHSFLGPNVDDDCNIVAFAPLEEINPPDIEIIRRNVPSKISGNIALHPEAAPYAILRGGKVSQ